MRAPAERDRAGEHLTARRRSGVTARRAAWATSTLVAVGIVVAAVAVETPAGRSSSHGSPTVGLRANESTPARGGQRSGKNAPAQSEASIAAAHPGATIGSPTGQQATASASRAFAAAHSSTDLPTVPASFEPNLVALYTSVYNAAKAIPGLSRFAKAEKPATFSAALGRLTKRGETELYGAVRAGSGLKGLSSAVNAFIPVERATARDLRLRPESHRSATSARTPGSEASEPHASGTETPQDLTTIPDTMPQTGSFGGGVDGTAYIVNCPSYWSTSIDPYADNAIYALQIVIDVASGVYNAASTFDDAFPVSAIAAALTLVAQEVQNDGIYLKGDYANCEDNNVQEAGLDIDNSTYQTYELLASVAGTANEADTNLVALINKNAADYEFELEGVIEQALSQPAGTAPMASLELPSTAGGYLDSTPVGVQSVVTTEIANLEDAGQLSSPLAERDLGLGGQAYAAGEYKTAFEYYRMAYQAASE